MFGIPNDENCDHSTGNTWLQHEDEWCSRVAQSKKGSWSDLCLEFVDRLSRNDNERGHKEHDRPIISPSLGSLSRRDYSSASLESHPAWCCSSLQQPLNAFGAPSHDLPWFPSPPPRLPSASTLSTSKFCCDLPLLPSHLNYYSLSIFTCRVRMGMRDSKKCWKYKGHFKCPCVPN